MNEAGERLPYDHHRGTDPLLRPCGRWRTWIFLGVNIAAFAAVNLFWQYLATGRWFDLSMEAYHRALTAPLSEMFLRPLSIFNYPWMITISAVLLAVIIFVPIVTAVLYHELVAMIFVLIVAGVGHATVLAFFQAGGCILAARTRLRSDMPFIASLLGLSPLGIYLYVFATVPADSPAAMPLQRWILCAPVGIAVLLAILATAAVLALAKITRFRPGALWPVLLAMLAAAVIMFYSSVGADELEYSLIAEELTGPKAMFQTTALEKWRADHDAIGLNSHTLRSRIEEDLQQRKGALIRRCEAFLESYEDSDRAAAVLWVHARVQSLLLDEAAYAGGLVKYSSTFTPADSRQTWRRLAEEYRGTPHAALALWRLGELAMRRGDAARADELLHDAAEQLRDLLARTADRFRADETSRMFAVAPDIPAQCNYEHYEDALLCVERLIWLMAQNNVLTDKRSAAALADYLKLNSQATDYLNRLEELAGRYENTEMGDNLKLAVAQGTADRHQRAQMLIQLAENKTTDAAIEANFALGRLAMNTAQWPELQLIEKLKRPEEYLKAIIAARDNPWQRRSASLLALIVCPKKRP